MMIRNVLKTVQYLTCTMHVKVKCREILNTCVVCENGRGTSTSITSNFRKVGRREMGANGK